MTIGIDIDDTMTNSSELMYENAKKHFGTDDMNLLNDLLHGNDITAKSTNFYNKYLIEMLKEYKLKPNVKEVIDRLRKQGHKVIIITARGFKMNLAQEEVTKKYLTKHQIIVDKMIFATRDKAGACIKNNVDLMIDDSVAILNEVAKTNTKTLLFNSISNKNIKTDLERVDTWLEIEKRVKEGM